MYPSMYEQQHHQQAQAAHPMQKQQMPMPNVSVREILEVINCRQKQALKFHKETSHLFDFLSLRGYKRLHEYRYLLESAENLELNRYAINHHNILLKCHCDEIEKQRGKLVVIPEEMFALERCDVTPQQKRDIIRTSFTAYKDWERETKDCLEEYYTQFIDINKGAGSQLVMCMLKSVDHELKRLERICLDLEAVEYNMVYIVACQTEMHDHYQAKTKEIGIDIS